MQALYSFEVGDEFIARVYADDVQESPWEREEGHGEVEFISDSDAVPRGWTVIHDENRGRWIYNTGAAIVKSRSEHWGCPDKYKSPGMSRGARAYAAVKADRDYLAAWLRGDWGHVGVSVSRIDADEDYSHALWGIDSGSEEYIREVAGELAGEL